MHVLGICMHEITEGGEHKWRVVGGGGGATAVNDQMVIDVLDFPTGL